MGIWDQSFKQIFFKYPADFAHWLADAEFLEELNPNLDIKEMEADALIRTWRKGREIIIHVECQKRIERTKTDRRVWEYNSSATIKHKLPIISYVLYLKYEGQIAQSPYEIWASEDEMIHRFRYYPVELYNIPTEELRAYGGIGGLALLPLTREGAQQEVIETIIQDVQEQVVVADDQHDLLSIVFSFASLAFEREEDQNWLARRFHMLDDILNETPFVKHLEARGEERGEKHGREEGFKQSLLTVVSARFPELLALAQKQTEHLTDTDCLNLLIVQISVAQTADDARQRLLEVQ